MPELKIDNSIIKRKFSVKFLGVLLDKNISREDHIKTIEKKLTKHMGLLYCAKPYFDKMSLKIYIFLIYSLIFKLCKHCLGKYSHNKIKTITI